eukprot:TRINITY_DN770_c0_g1_i1.p1 TRINITY_DN770_c0_g1~~TRINITY_DN770_c0_g1_i1.p1  ORF type:complete len:544 (-),score=72.70 TRINITY_DN770_c0_g1_i1:685-2316(-)
MAAMTRTPRAGSAQASRLLSFRLTNEAVYFVGVILFMTVATFVDTQRLTRAAQMHRAGAWSGKPGKLLLLRSQALSTSGRSWRARRSMVEEHSSSTRRTQSEEQGRRRREAEEGDGRSRGEQEDNTRVSRLLFRLRFFGDRGHEGNNDVSSSTLRLTGGGGDSSSQGGKEGKEGKIDIEIVLANDLGGVNVKEGGQKLRDGGEVAAGGAGFPTARGISGGSGRGPGLRGTEPASRDRGDGTLLSLPQRCPPMFASPPDCRGSRNDVPAALRLAVPSLQGPFTEPFTLLRKMVEGKSRVVSSMLPDWEHETNIGPVDSGLLEVLPTEDVAFGGENYRRCAIVGSSGILLSHKDGPAIDSHDLVFRFNSAPTRGFEEQVGARTTHRITNTRNFNFRESDKEVVFVHLRSGRPLRYLRERRTARPLQLLFGLNPEFHRYMDRTFGFLSTSGLCGIVIALHKCVEVNLYGFHVSESHGVPYHYYNRTDVPANEGRDSSEWKVVKALAESNYVQFMQPCILECHDKRDDGCEKCLRETSTSAEAASQK